MPAALEMRVESRLPGSPFRQGTVATVALRDRKPASLPPLEEHVQPGTRNDLMINHCQPLFWLKTWLLGELCSEGLFGVCCYEIAFEPQRLEGAVRFCPVGLT